jgi:hypothetical protein
LWHHSPRNVFNDDFTATTRTTGSTRTSRTACANGHIYGRNSRQVNVTDKNLTAATIKAVLVRSSDVINLKTASGVTRSKTCCTGDTRSRN